MKLGDLIDNLKRIGKAHGLDADVWISMNNEEQDIRQINVHDYVDEGTTSDVVLEGEM